MNLKIAQEYDAFCETANAPPHLRSWWLDAVCGDGRWSVALARDAGGAITGALPWSVRRKWGLPIIQTPPLTAYAGPWLQYPDHREYKQVSRYTFEKQVLDQLTAQLPRLPFQQTFHPDIQNWLPFYWKGYRQTTRYTFIYQAIPSENDLLSGFKSSVRTHLRKVADRIVVHETNDIRLIADLHQASLFRRGIRRTYSVGIYERLFGALQGRDQARAWQAVDASDQSVHAVMLLAFDQRRAYVVCTGLAPKHRASGAIFSLWMQAFHFCRAQGLSLDFEGSMDAQIEHHFRALGGRMQPYFLVWKWL